MVNSEIARATHHRMHFLQGLRQPANRRLAHSMEDGRQTQGLVQGVPNRRGEWIPMDGLPTCPSPKWHLEVRHHFVPIYSSVTIYRHLPSPSANPRIGDQSTVYLAVTIRQFRSGLHSNHRACPIYRVRSMKSIATQSRHTSTQHNSHSRQSTGRLPIRAQACAGATACFLTGLPGKVAIDRNLSDRGSGYHEHPSSRHAGRDTVAASCAAPRYCRICSASPGDACHSMPWQRLRKVTCSSLRSARWITTAGKLLRDSLPHSGQVIGK